MFVLSTYATFLFSLKGPVGESSRLTGIQFSSSAAAERKSLSIGRVIFSVQLSFNPGEEPCSFMLSMENFHHGRLKNSTLSKRLLGRGSGFNQSSPAGNFICIMDEGWLFG